MLFWMGTLQNVFATLSFKNRKTTTVRAAHDIHSARTDKKEPLIMSTGNPGMFIDFIFFQECVLIFGRKLILKLFTNSTGAWIFPSRSRS